MIIDSSLIEGNSAAQLFVDTAKKYNYTIIRKASPSEDMFQHWDFLISNKEGKLKVDVKAHKHEYRNGPLLKDWFYIEWKNVRGENGWIDGMADLIAFQYNKYFYLFRRNSLQTFAKANTNFSKVATRSLDCKYCIYTRKDRKDQISMVKISDLVKIEYPSIWTI